MIQIRPQRGSYVNKISLSHVLNGCFVRQSIEYTVVRRAAISLNHISPLEMLLQQYVDIFSGLEKRGPDQVEIAMTLHVDEISQSVQLIQQENSNWFSDK